MKPRLRSLLWGFMALTLLLSRTTLECAYDITFSNQQNACPRICYLLLRCAGEQLVF